MSDKVQIAIIIGSTRPQRKGDVIAQWAFDIARERKDAVIELIDLREVGLPLLDEPLPASRRLYAKEHSRAWAAVVDGFDGFVFVTPEYNHSYPGVLKNAIDFAYEEWNDKAAAFVSYGFHGGQRAAEHLRLVMSQLRVATVQAQVCIYLHQEFDQHGSFIPGPQQRPSMGTMLDQLVDWSQALRTLRNQRE